MNLSRDQGYTLLGILLALFLGALDQTIVSTALPRIVEDLHGLERYDWVATSYLLASTVLVPVYGRLADLYSRKTIELWAVIVFLGGSMLCGLAGEFGTLPLLGDGMTQLILFRAVQGAGGAGLFALAFIIIADLFPASERGRYQGFVGAVFGIASVLGPLVGGFLTDYGGALVPGIEGWRWVFYVNLPFGALALWFIVTRMPALHPPATDERLNYLSAVLLLAGLVPFVLALRLDKAAHPWGAPETLFLFAAALLFTGLFIARSLRARHPILDFQLFRDRVFTTGNLALFFLGGAFLSILVFLPLFMVEVVGVSATAAGLSLMPLSMGLVAGSTVAGHVVSRFGHYRRLMLGGGVVLLGGLVLLARMQPEVTYGRIVLYMALCGIGMGPSFPLYTLAIQNAVDVRRIGQATSASQFFRQIGGVIGVAVLGTVFAVTLTQGLAGALPGGVPTKVASAGEGMQGSGLDVEATVQARYEARRQALAAAVASGDRAAVAAVAAEAGLPEPLTAELQRDGVRAAAALGTARALLAAHAAAEASRARAAVRAAFAEAITRLYWYAFAFVLVSLVVTVFIPERPLRRTLDGAAGGGR